MARGRLKHNAETRPSSVIIAAMWYFFLSRYGSSGLANVMAITISKEQGVQQRIPAPHRYSHGYRPLPTPRTTATHLALSVVLMDAARRCLNIHSSHTIHLPGGFPGGTANHSSANPFASPNLKGPSLRAISNRQEHRIAP